MKLANHVHSHVISAMPSIVPAAGQTLRQAMRSVGRASTPSVQASGRTDGLRALGRTDWVLAVRPPSDRQSDGLISTLRWLLDHVTVDVSCKKEVAKEQNHRSRLSCQIYRSVQMNLVA